ncbi:Clavaminate synthase-like protein [Punctularia strigosozonata HHB-11173 SS5]|uniref:Clavaminate synthase-like protein n=1 Tax=Punctularia strigosozonata (strain HHB-11173) TaxID=741275 RepID=UPI0004418074|nr:Clavaminate synthase-like protein [Punctularia strigosozonata HHB-11173 SS5]EIN12600.1 Clavaminate synthase-like protein [Punctularia strigosozonata HHB-11173 SS5]
MGDIHVKPGTLPIINIGPYLHTDDHPGRLSVAAQLHSACLEFGFFYLDLGSFIEPGEPEELQKLAREFFAKPQEEKDKIGLAHQDGARGYQRLKENVTNGKADNHEGIDFYRPVDNPDKSRPLWGENQWPEDPPQFREKFEAWTEKMKKLGVVVMEAMAVGLGMTHEEWEQLKSQVDESFWVMRVIGYPPLPNNYDGFSCGAHKDYGCLTFLYQDDTKSALQVWLENSEVVETDAEGNISGLPSEELAEGVWIDADPIPGCVVCNIGEMWEVWTNGLYKSTLHRVVHRGANYRVSIPFFFEPNFNAEVKPLAAALRIQSADDDAHAEQKKYEPVVYGDFLLKKVGNNFATGKGKYD